MAFDALETPFGKRDRIVGGAATYIGIAASYFTKDIKLVSVVGGDFPNEMMQELAGRGINLEGVEIKKNEKTFFWHGRYHIDLNTRDTVTTELNVLGDFNPQLPQDYKNPDLLMLGNLSPVVQKSVISQLDEKPLLIAMDTMNFWMDVALEDLKSTLKLADLLIINDEEARQLTGEYSLVKAAALIQKMGPKYLIIKKGENGALLFQEGNVFFAPALPLEDVFDPTGAGDTFAGGFMGYLARTGDISFQNMKRAVIYGSAMASFCVEKFGTEKLLEINHEMIRERVEKFSELVDFDTVELEAFKA
jgi:sugar/nucleoside kinase (ribokinase family)